MGDVVYLSRMGRSGFSHASAITSQRTYTSTIASLKNMSFDEFREKKCLSLTDYKASLVIKAYYKLDEQKTEKAYELYCQARYQVYCKTIEKYPESKKQ